MNGRTASCTATRSVSGRSEASAFSTDSCRLSPPSTTRTLPDGNSLARMALTQSRSSGRTATTISATRSEAANLRTVWIRIGEPSSSMNCLRLVPAFSADPFPMRVPRPAAGNMTAIRIDLRFYRGFLPADTGDRRSGLRLTPARRPLVLFRPGHGVHPLIVLAENHLAGGRLEHAGDGDVDGLRDHLLGVVHHHHGAVVEVGHALAVLLALLENEHPHGLARQDNGLQRIRQLVDVQHLDAVELRDFIEVEIVRDHLAVVDLGQLDQLHVDVADVGEIVLDDLHIEVRHLLDALQNVEPAAAAVALHGIGRIGDELQLAQDELRNHQNAVEEAGFGDIGDAAVDDDARIQDLERLLRRFFAPEDAAQRREIQHVALLRADDEADVRHQQQQADLQERLLLDGAIEHQRHQEGPEDPEDRADGRADETLQADLFQTDFKKYDAYTQQQAGPCSRNRTGAERVKRISGNGDNEYKNGANQ